MISGLIISRDVFYFLLVIFLFIGLSMLKLQSGRESKPLYVKLTRYVGLFVAIVILGFVTSMPSATFYYDMTANKNQTITENSQRILLQLTEPVKITTYVNLLDEIYYFGIPEYKDSDMATFDRYRRFLPDLQEYVYYYDKSQNTLLYQQNPGLNDKQLLERVKETRGFNLKEILTPEQIKKKINLEPEENRFVRQLSYKGKTSFLRMYDDLYRYSFEAEMSAAFKRLLQVPPKVAFLQGHGERSIVKIGDKDYKIGTTALTFRYSLINQGFDVVSLSVDDLPKAQDVSILVIADPQSSFSDQERARIDAYLSQGKMP